MRLLNCFFVLFIYSCFTSTSKYEVKEYTKLTSRFVDTLSVKYQGEIIYRLQILITGNIEEGGTLKYSHIPYEIFKEVKLKGKVDEEIDTDWYDDKVLLIYEPLIKDGNVKDNLKIEYKLN